MKFVRIGSQNRAVNPAHIIEVAPEAGQSVIRLTTGSQVRDSRTVDEVVAYIEQATEPAPVIENSFSFHDTYATAE